MKLKTKNSIKGLSLLLISCGLLTACHQTGSSTNTSAANATQDANQAQTQKYLSVINDTGSTIDNLSIFSESGQLLYRSSTGLNCANQQSCDVDIKSLIASKTMLAKFYNSKNQLISMSSPQSNSQKLKFSAVYANDTVFGAHLFSQLINFQKSNKQSINAPDLLQKLNKLFKNQKANLNVFEELGTYYSQQLSQGKIQNERDFYAHISNDLAQGKSITTKVSLLSTTPPLLQAPLLGCDHAVADRSAQVASTIAPFMNFIPEFGSIFNGLFSGSAAIIKDICPSETFNIALAFSGINTKLDSIQQSIDTLTSQVDTLYNVANNIELKRLLNDLDKYYQTDDNLYNKEYLSFLLDTKSNNLLQYVTDHGGLDNLSETKEPVLFNLLNNMGPEKLNLDEMNSVTQFDQISNVINNLCAESGSITGDVIAKRNYCNTITTNIGIRNAAIIEKSRLRMSDKIAAINTMTNPGNIFMNPFGVTWSDALTAMKANMATDLDNLDKYYKATLVNPVKGFPQQLVNTLNMPGNPLHCLDSSSTPSGVNGLISWSAKDKSITTSCYQNESNTKLITSDYPYGDYAAVGNRVENVLGMLVNKDLDRQIGYINAHAYFSGATSKVDEIAYYSTSIDTSQLPGLVVSGTPYMVFNNSTAAFISENNKEYSSDEARHHWRDSPDYSHAPESIHWSGTGNRSYYYLKKTSESTIHYNMWVPKCYINNGTRPDAECRHDFLVAHVDMVLYWPVTDNHGQPVGESVVFALSHDIGNSISRYGGLHADIGLKCLTLNCGADRRVSTGTNNASVSFLYIKLKNGQTAEIQLVNYNGHFALYHDVHK